MISPLWMLVACAVLYLLLGIFQFDYPRYKKYGLKWWHVALQWPFWLPLSLLVTMFRKED